MLADRTWTDDGGRLRTTILKTAAITSVRGETDANAHNTFCAWRQHLGPADSRNLATGSSVTLKVAAMIRFKRIRRSASWLVLPNFALDARARYVRINRPELAL